MLFSPLPPGHQRCRGVADEQAHYLYLKRKGKYGSLCSLQSSSFIMSPPVSERNCSVPGKLRAAWSYAEGTLERSHLRGVWGLWTAAREVANEEGGGAGTT